MIGDIKDLIKKQDYDVNSYLDHLHQNILDYSDENIDPTDGYGFHLAFLLKHIFQRGNICIKLEPNYITGVIVWRDTDGKVYDRIGSIDNGYYRLADIRHIGNAILDFMRIPHLRKDDSWILNKDNITALAIHLNERFDAKDPNYDIFE